MNQDQTKEILLRLEPQVPDFHLVFTGKASRKVNGLYRPELREILLHNKNFSSDEELIYTAVHEFAHHLHFCSSARPSAYRSHTVVFWSLFHRLLAKAEELGVYKNVFTIEPEFTKLTDEIQNKYLKVNGQLMKDLGQALLQAVQLCGKHHVCFEDYMDRVLCIPRGLAKTVMAAFAQDITPDYGFDHMKTLAGVKDPEVRRDMDLKRREGYSPQMLKQELNGDPLPEVAPSVMPDPIVAQKEILERALEEAERVAEKAEKRVAEIREKIESLVAGDGREVAHRQLDWGF